MTRKWIQRLVAAIAVVLLIHGSGVACCDSLFDETSGNRFRNAIQNNWNLRFNYGCLLVGGQFADSANLDASENQLAIQAIEAVAQTKLSIGGALIFQIDDPALAVDPYWKYYADCDRWDVVFAKDYFRSYTADKTIRITRLASIGQQYAWALTLKHRREIEVAVRQMIDFVRPWIEHLQSDEWQMVSTKRASSAMPETERAVSPLPILIRLASSQLANSTLFVNPERWLQNQMDQLEIKYGRTLIGGGIIEFRRQLYREIQDHVFRNQRAQIDLARSIATYLDHWSLELHQLAQAVQRNADRQARKLTRLRTAKSIK